ncbi:hypothetical protein D9757_002705 [Collybiopsis confluens]|uniref:Gfd2/YDR514C-like C-terminal domain-containing protein n=1 Tax=Collybiopsis confluens TaxID=2823264 RepID=A0A8H5HW12_9AGAR|nr:hypothetical protein D9757_002705 [Collybiopsis confluens]
MTGSVKGYYRYTDIWFKWPEQKDVGPEAAEAIKAVLAHDALCSNENPLHIDGVDGAQLFIGTLKSGENRILFSSKQVEYIRYWVHAMRLTESLAPLPHSNCLLRDQDLRGVCPQVFKTGGDLKIASKQIGKNNKSIKKSNDPPLTFRRNTFERVRSLWQGKVGVWCAVDFEAWELDHRLITEFGWSLIRWEDGKEVQQEGHLIVKEHRLYTNSVYVRGNRDNYKHGVSEIVTKKDFKDRVQKLFHDLKSNDSVFLVFHDANEDIKYLRSSMVEVDLTGLSYTLPSGSSPQNDIFVVDTVDLFGGLQGEGNSSRGLEQVCNQLGLNPEFMHNAGNDAHYTLAACKEMANGDAVDLQRDKRWPGQTVPGTLRVDIDALDDEDAPESDDLEEIYQKALN